MLNYQRVASTPSGPSENPSFGRVSSNSNPAAAQAQGWHKYLEKKHQPPKRRWVFPGFSLGMEPSDLEIDMLMWKKHEKASDKAH